MRGGWMGSDVWDKVPKKRFFFTPFLMVEGKCLDTFESYLTNCKVRTVIDGAKSKILDVNAGVPQGSRLGPLLWILFNQDIIDNLD